jgi:hypothetical protein
MLQPFLAIHIVAMNEHNTSEGLCRYYRPNQRQRPIEGGGPELVSCFLVAWIETTPEIHETHEQELVRFVYFVDRLERNQPQIQTDRKTSPRLYFRSVSIRVNLCLISLQAIECLYHQLHIH